jgi:hypothetical protein
VTCISPAFCSLFGSSSGRKYAIEQQNKNLNFLFIYCADVPAEIYKLPSHRQCVAVGGKANPTKKQTNKDK